MADSVAASRVYTFLARSSVLLAGMAALGSLLFGLLATFGLIISQAIGTFDSGSLYGSVIYFVCNVLLVRSIYRAGKSRGELSWQSPAAVFMIVVLLAVICFANLFAVAALIFTGFDFGYLIYGSLTLLLALRIHRAKSPKAIAAMLLLALLAPISLTVGGIYSRYDGEPQHNGPSGTALADRVTELRKEHSLVGLAAMVMVDGKVVATAAHGERKKGSGVALQLNDRWHLGSITKSITATMLGRLVESGRMKWTDTIGECFPDAAIHEDWKPVTLQQLLTHTSGAPANFSLNVMLTRPAPGPACTLERRKAVLELMAEKPMHPPGQNFAYSNVGYTIAGAMAETRTGSSWEDLVTREVFEPLKLTGTGFGPPKSPSATLDQPRGHRGMRDWKSSATDAQDNTPIIGPAGTVHMTLHDLCTYATEHLRGERGSAHLLTSETFKQLHTPRLQDYASGWVVKSPTDDIHHTVYWHNGSNTMWYALVVFIPDQNMVVAVTANDGDIRSAETAAWKVVQTCANNLAANGAAPQQSKSADTGKP